MFKWTKQQASFVPEIDAEHRAFYRLCDELQHAVTAGAGEERLNTIVHSIVASLEDHFSHEERLMRASRYPIFAWHKQQHDAVRRKMKELEASLARGDTGAPQELVEYLAHWLKGHLSLTDRMFGAYLRNFGRLHAVAS